MEKTAATSSSLGSAAPSDARGAELRAIALTGMRGTPAWATNAAATTSISLRCCSRRFATALHIFQGVLAAQAASGSTGSCTAPAADLDAALGLNLPPGSPCRLLSHIGGLCLCFCRRGGPEGGGKVVVVNLVGAETGTHWVKRSSTPCASLTQGRHCQTSTRGSANGTHDVPCVGR